MKEVKSETLNLNIKKSSTKGSILATILKQCTDIYLPFLTNAINSMFLDSFFPKELQKAEIIPVCKNDDPLKKENCRPVILLPLVPKIFVAHIAWKNGKKALDKGENVCTIFMDLSKAFVSINHDLLLVKLKAYGFSENALKLICSYFKDRRQAVQISNNFSSYKKVQAGVPKDLLMVHFSLTY